ncbi:MAG: thymidylate synthase [Candidatus Microsaccharimonas sp.]
MPVSITYEEVLRDTFENGVHKEDRTGTGTRSIPGATIRYDLREGFPLITTKQVPFRLIATELLWFLSGSSNIRGLLLEKNHIWDEWAYKRYLTATGQEVPSSDSQEWKDGIKAYAAKVVEDEAFALQYGDLGPVYGVQWRHWKSKDGGEVDQIAKVMDLIANNPDSRRIVVSAWRPDELPEMALEPCHNMFQFHVANGVLSIVVTQRSADMFLGVPFNIASYALLAHMVAQQTGLQVGSLTWNGGDVHVYDNHVEQVELQLSREPRTLPTLIMPSEETKPKSIFDYELSDFTVKGYLAHDKISAPVAV